LKPCRVSLSATFRTQCAYIGLYSPKFRAQRGLLVKHPPGGVGGSPGDLGEQELFGPIFGE